MAGKVEKTGQAKISPDTTSSSPVDSSLQSPLPILRRLAEKYLQEKKNCPAKEPEVLSPEKYQKIISELQLNQLELELQNDELRRTKKGLEFARDRYFDLYDLAPVGYCTVSEEGLILETNLTAANLLCVDRGELPNQLFSRFILSDDHGRFYVLRKRLFETGESQSGELRLIRQDGSTFWVNLETTLGLNESGVTVSHVVLSNITERKEAEEALRKSHRQNQTILDSITDAFISVSSDMVISYLNDAAEKILEKKRIALIGCHLFDVFPEGKGSIFESNCSKAMRAQSPIAFEAEFNLASCQNWYGVRVYPSFDGITISLRVITERKKRDEEKAKFQSLKRQLRKAESLERMAGAIAHLFNNHLQVALASLELALESLDGDAVARDYLVKAIQANRRSSDVNGMLLTYLGQNISKVEPLDLAKICQKSLSGIETAIPSSIKIATHFMSPGPIVQANAGQIQQILTILITNSCEAIGGRSGKVTVVIKPVPASMIPKFHVSHIDWATDCTKFACLEVTDTGCGMSDEQIGEIFDPFYTTKFTGRGLGLAVAMGLIRAWRGMIHVNSEVNTGSCFRVFLPLAEDAAPWQPAPEAEKETLMSKKSVLLVDDNPVACEIVQAVLEHLGFTVFVAIGGREAITLYQKHQSSIDCVLTDLSMPDMDGWETIAALRKINPDLPAILTSGYDEAHVMQGEHKELPQAFLHKPYRKDELKNELYRILRDTDNGST